MTAIDEIRKNIRDMKCLADMCRSDQEHGFGIIDIAAIGDTIDKIANRITGELGKLERESREKGPDQVFDVLEETAKDE